MERAPGETALIDRTGRMLKMEPLATVESLEQYLLKMVRMHTLLSSSSEVEQSLVLISFSSSSTRWRNSGMTLSVRLSSS